MTSEQCIKGFRRFKKKLNFLSKPIKRNFYFIAKDQKTKLSFKRYCSNLKKFNLNFSFLKETNYNFLDSKKIEGGIKCDEELILIDKAKKYFKKTIGKNIIYNCKIKKILRKNNKYIINNKEYDFVINTTWMQFNNYSFRNLTYEYCTILKYKSIKKNHPAVTIMDGPFYTLYPWDDKNNYGLYSVKNSRIFKSKNLNYLKRKVNKHVDTKYLNKIKIEIEKNFLIYYPDFKKYFKFDKHLTSYRTLINNKNDSRLCYINYYKNLINVMSGKIDHIFFALDEVEKWIKKF